MMKRRSKERKTEPEVAAVVESSPPIAVGSSGQVLVEFDTVCIFASVPRIQGERIEVDHLAGKRIERAKIGRILKG